MRVVVLTQVPEVAAEYAQLVPALGHEIVAIVVGRPVAGDPSVFLETSPGADVVFASSRDALGALLCAYSPDVGLCTGFPWRISQDAIDVPRLGIVNSHPTMLPKGRGPHPWAWAVRNGETELGVTFHYMDATLDTGNVLAQAPVAFTEDDTHDTLFPKLSAATRELLPEVFAKLESGDPGVPQGEREYQPRFEREYAAVDTTRTAAEVHRQVRAWSWVPPRSRSGPVLDGERLVRTSLTEVEGGRRIECADAPLWVVESVSA